MEYRNPAISILLPDFHPFKIMNTMLIFLQKEAKYMKSIRKCISYFLIITLLSALFATGTVSAESSHNYAVCAPIEKLELGEVNVSVNVDTNSYYGGIDKIIDGKGMVDGVTITNGMKLILTDLDRERWMSTNTGVTPTFEITFASAVAIDTIKWAEVRRNIGNYKFEFYNGNTKLDYTKSGVFTDTSEWDDNCIYLRSVPLDQVVVADKIVFTVESCLKTDKWMSILEMEFYGVEGTEVICSFDASANDGEISFSENLEKAFDDNSETVYTADISEIAGSVTINFNFLSVIIGDTIFIGSDDVENINLYGSINGEDYFEISYDNEEKYYYFSDEYLKSVKMEIYPVDGCDELSITDIGLYETNYEDELHSMKAFLEGKDTSLITDEDIDNITQNLNSLPVSLGNYTIEWRSENSDIIDVETGRVNTTYIDQHVQIYADFIRDDIVHKTNSYKLIVDDDGSLDKINKFNFNANATYTNESINIISSAIWDKNNLDPTDTKYGSIETLYDEANKTSGFNTGNNYSCLTYPMSSAEYVFELPVTIQFDFDKFVLVNNLAVYEYRNRIKKAHIEVSADGEIWTPVIDSVSLTAKSANESDASFVVKNIAFPLTYTKHIRLVIDELATTTQFAAYKLCEVVFYSSQGTPLVGQEAATNISDRDSSTNVEVEHGESIVLDFGSIQGFDGVKWFEAGNSVKDYSISVSNDGQHWLPVKEGALEDNHSIAEVDFDYQVARFVKVDIESIYLDDATAISEIYVVEESPATDFVLEKNLAKLIFEDETDILVDEDLLLLGSNNVNLPESVCNYTIEWDLSQAPMINESGEVTHGEEDISGVIGVKVTDSNLNWPIYENSFPIVSKTSYNSSEYYIATSKDEFTGVYDFDKPEGFLFNQDNMLIEFTMAENSVVSVNSEAKLFEIETSEESILVTYKDSTKTIPYSGGDVPVRALIRNNQFDLYMNYDNTRYKGIISKGEYLGEFGQGIKEIESTEEVTDIRFGLHKENIDDFLNQFAFSHISDETMYTVSDNLDLLDEIIGLPITWTSFNSATINALTGEVDLSVEPEYVRLKMDIDVPNVVTWNKDFYVAVNLPNLISDANISVNAAAYDDNSVQNIKDADITTSFLTSYKNSYAVKVTLPEQKLISRCVLIENNSSGYINAYNIYVDDTLVYSGDKLNGFKEHILDGKYGTEIRIEVTSTEGITGFYEIGIHSELTNEQKVKLDINTIKFDEKYENGQHSLPVIGAYGSSINYSSNKDVVSFETVGDSVIMTVNNPDVDTSVVITVNASLDDSVATKTFSIVADGKTEITTTPPSGGGGGGGGSSGGGSKNELFTGTTPAPEVIPYVPIQQSDELTGHWGEKELRSLVEKGIVQGDGNGYNLTKSVSRAEFITMLIRAMGKSLSVNEPVFDDVSPDSWYADEIQTAYELGWISGYNNNSMPSANITREEMAKIICIAMGIEISKDNNLDFTDKNEQSVWAVEYINSLYSHNIINGYEDGSFRPKNVLKRDEAMIVIYRILEKEAK